MMCVLMTLHLLLSLWPGCVSDVIAAFVTANLGVLAVVCQVVAGGRDVRGVNREEGRAEMLELKR